MSDQRLAAKREARLDEILAALWKGQLTREAAINRIKAELGLSYRDALAEVNGFL
jgi:dTDP-4-amino-4,6-dideoxygalactose transaminase